MAPRSLIAAITILFVLSLCLVVPTGARGACCTKFIKKKIPPELILGYSEISDTEFCRRKAIIFLLKGNRKVCVSPAEEWVPRILDLLSSKLNKMSKAAKTQMNKRDDGSGRFSSTTESVRKTTEGFDW